MMFNPKFIFIFCFFISTALNSAASLSSDQPIKAIIFDCDGVLVDTEYLKFCAWQQILKPYDVAFTLEKYMPLVGNNLKSILGMVAASERKALPDTLISDWYAAYKTLHQKNVPSIEGTVNFARWLAAHKEKLGIKLGLASSPPHDEISRNINHARLHGVFDVVVSGEDDLDAYEDKEGKNKPKPYVYLEAAKRLNCHPRNCLVFEDTAAGIQAAASAGMIAIAIPNSFTASQNFIGARKVISSLRELNEYELFRNIDFGQFD